MNIFFVSFFSYYKKCYHIVINVLAIYLLFCLIYSFASAHEREYRHNELVQPSEKYLSPLLKLPLNKHTYK